MDSAEHDDFKPSKCFRRAKLAEEERKELQNAVPMSTRYKNKWAVNVFVEWINARENKLASLEKSGFTCQKDIENLNQATWDRMQPSSLNFWLGKFLQCRHLFHVTK